MKKSLAVAALAAIVTLTACMPPTDGVTTVNNTFGGYDPDGITSITGSPANAATLPIDQISVLAWDIVQSDEVTELNVIYGLDSNGTLVSSSVSGSGNTTDMTPVLVVAPVELSPDSATQAYLYFDVFFGTERNNLQLVDSFDQDEWDPNVSSDISDILTALNIARLEVNQTYYWSVVATDSLGNKSETSTYSFTTAPPQNYSEFTLDRDMGGWYLDWEYVAGAYDTIIGDLLISDLTTWDPEAAYTYTNIQGVEYGTTVNTWYKQYLTAGSITAGTSYYARFDSKDTNDTDTEPVTTTGAVYRVIADESLSDISYWGIQGDTDSDGTVDTLLSDTAVTTLANGNDALISWNTVAYDHPVLTYAITYNLYVQQGGTAPTADLDAANLYMEDAGTSEVVTFPASETYYIQVEAVGTNSSASMSTRSPIVQVSHLGYTGGNTYTFSSGDTIPANDATDNNSVNPSEVFASNAANVVTFGNPFPALELTTADDIKTDLPTYATPYSTASVSFDFRSLVEGSNFYIYLGNNNLTTAANATEDAFSRANVQADLAATPTGDVETGNLKGVWIALESFADDPTTAAAADRQYRFYVYYLDDTQDTDADGTPDVVMEPVTGSDVSVNTWHNVQVDINIAGNLEIYFDGAASPYTVDLSNMGTGNLNLLTAADYGLNHFALVGDAATTYVDNFSYTVSDATYSRVID